MQINSSKRKLAFIIPQLSISGGAERVISNLSYLLSPHFDIFGVVFQKTKSEYCFNGRVIYIDDSPKSGYLNKIVNFFKRVSKLSRIKKEYEFDICISFLEAANLVNCLSGNSKSIRILSIRSFPKPAMQELYGKFDKLVARFLYKKAHAIVLTTKEACDFYLKTYHPSNKILSIYNPFKLTEILELGKENLEEDESRIFENPVVIAIGSFREVKGHWHLIRSFKLISEKIGNSQLVILGDGIWRNKYQTLIEQLGLTKKVHLLGIQENPFKYLSRSAVFVMPSHFEGFPNALVEAMVCGVPVISSDCSSGPSEILCGSVSKHDLKKCLTTDYGILVPEMSSPIDQGTTIGSDEKLLAQAITDILTNASLRSKIAASVKKRALEFEDSKIAQDWLNLINNISSC